MNIKKTRFFWVYTIILFTVALVLIMMGLTMTNVKKDYKSQVQTLQTEKETLYQTKIENESTISALEEKNRLLTESLSTAQTAAENYAQAVEKIYEADALYDEGAYEEAKTVIESIDTSILKERIHKRYDYVKNKIEAKL